MKAYINMEKVIKFGDIEIKKQKFHQHKEPISIKDIDINKILLATRMLKKLNHYVYFSPK